MRTPFEDEQHAIGKLKNLERKRSGVHARNAGRQAAALRVFLICRGDARFVERLGPRLHRNFDGLFDRRTPRPLRPVSGKIRDRAGIPHTFAVSKIRMAVGEARRRSGVRRGGSRHVASAAANPLRE
jgi:hypothetical protein